MSKIFLAFLLFSPLLFPSTVSAQVVINEFSSPSSNDWVELYNYSENEIDLSNYSLKDGSTSGNTKTFSCILAPHGFCVAEWGNKLNNAGDIIRLISGESVVDCIAYGNGDGQLCDGKTEVELGDISTGQFGARDQDGIGSWQISTSSTKDGPNDGSQKDAGAICITPTPSPISTPIPTPDPTATNTPTPTTQPTSTPTLTPTLKPTKTPTPTMEVEGESGENGVLLGLRDEILPTPTPEPESEKRGKFPLLAGLFITLGLGFIGAAGYPFYKDWKKRYNIKDGERKEKPEFNA